MLKVAKNQLINISEEVKWFYYEAFKLTPFYSYVLKKHSANYLLTLPSSMWSGNLEIGHEIISGVFIFRKEKLSTQDIWSFKKVSSEFFAYLHKFEWLYHLREVGSSQARNRARELIKLWLINFNKYNKGSWQPNIAGPRLASWIGLSDFFCSSARDDFRHELFKSIAAQSEHLYRYVRIRGNNRLKELLGFKGLIFANLALPDVEKGRLVNILMELETELQNQVHNDGGHFSESPYKQLIILRDLIEIRAILSYFHKPIPPRMQDSIEKMILFMRLLMHSDGSLARFNDDDVTTKGLIGRVLKLSNVSKKLLCKKSTSCLESLHSGRSLILMNFGKQANLEISIGSEKVIRGKQVVGFTEDRLKKIVGKFKFTSNSKKNFIEGKYLIEIFRKFIGQRKTLSHVRTICLMNDGNDIRGEDVFCGVKNENLVINFPFHYKIKKVALSQDSKSVIICLSKGIMWRFQVGSNVGLSVSEVDYFNSGNKIHFSQQIIISGRMEKNKTTIKWALKRM